MLFYLIALNKLWKNLFISILFQEEAVFQPLLAENFDDTELEAMNKAVTEQHAFYREKVKTEKSLKAVKRKLSEEVFETGDDFGLDSSLRFKKSYCQEVNERLRKKKKEEPDADIKIIPPDVAARAIPSKDESIFSKISR